MLVVLSLSTVNRKISNSCRKRSLSHTLRDGMNYLLGMSTLGQIIWVIQSSLQSPSQVLCSPHRLYKEPGHLASSNCLTFR